MKKYVHTIILGLISLATFAQTNWQKGGNNALPAGSLPILGTTYNAPLNIITNNTQRMTILGTNGFVGIGNILTPVSLLHVHQANAGGVSALKYTTAGTGISGGDGLDIGISPVGDAFFINNEPNQRFSWYNQGGGGPGTLLGRMRLYDGGVGQNTGRLVLGDDIPLSFVPQSRLHIIQAGTVSANGNLFRTDGDNTQIVQWQLFTGSSVSSNTEKFKLFIPANTNNAYLQSTNGYLAFNTLLTGITTRERVRIFEQSNTLNLPFGGGMAIHALSSPVTQPGALLHIGEPFAAGSLTGVAGLLGWRQWMSVGTFNLSSTDNMYVGMKSEGSDRVDAVINWGDNTTGSPPIPTGPDYLRFVYTQSFTNAAAPNAASLDGMEVGRFSPLGNFGIGNFYNSTGLVTTDPARRLEVLTDFSTSATGVSQQRITYAQQDPANPNTTGKFAEFFETINGDLGIGTLDNTQSNTATKILKSRFVGINTATPGNTVEINSQYLLPSTPNGEPPAGFGPPTGWAGLRFSDLKSSSVPQANPTASVLSVDANGDVILVPGSNVIGGYCSSVVVPLSGNFGIDLNAHNYSFYSAAGSGTGTVQVGDVGCSNLSAARLYVRNNNGPTFTAFRADVTIPIGGIAGFFTAPNNSSSYAGNFVGPVFVNSPGFSGNNYVAVVSDSSMKKNIIGIADALSLVKLLKPKSYFLRTDNTIGLDFSGKHQFGFLAQDVAGVLPELVDTLNTPVRYDTIGNVQFPSTTISTLKVDEIIPITIKAIQEQQLSIDSLRNNHPTVVADNGLTVNSGAVELGGSLNQNTTISQGNNNLDFTLGNGNFSVGTSNTSSGTGVKTIGAGNTASNTSDNAVAVGNSNLVEGPNAMAFGTAVASSGTMVGIGSSTNSASPTVWKNAGYDFRNVAPADYGSIPGINIYQNIVGIKKVAQSGLYAMDINGATTAELNGSLHSTPDALPAFSSSTSNFTGVSRAYASRFTTDGTATDQNVAMTAVANSPTSGSLNIAVNAYAPNLTNSFAGFFDGNVNINGKGTITSGSWSASDQQFKTNIDSISNALSIIDQLKPKTFFFDTANAYGLNFDVKKQYGFIAQDVQTVLPELVENFTKPADHDANGNVIHPSVTYKNLNYNGFFAIMMKGMQEQNKKIRMQDSLIREMSAALNSCCSNINGRTSFNNTNSNTINQIDVELSDANAFYLLQNQPNPFSDRTTIGFNVPDFKSSAVINFYNNNGEQIKSVNISTKGKGQLNISISELANGMYSYSLVVDGSIKATKKMVKSE